MAKPQPVRTGDQTLVRQINLSVIMHHLRANAPISRASLADITGLNKTTVSSLIKELTARQFVQEIGYDTVGTGRPAILLTLNPDAGFIVSAEIGVDFILVICTDFTPEIVWRHMEYTDPAAGQEAIIERALAVLRQAITEGYRTGGNLLGLIVGVPGLVDQSTGTLLFAPNLQWQDVPLCDILSRHFKTRLFVDNEANLAALAEHYFGAAQGYDDVLYISAGVGLGGGMVLGGQLFRGVTGVGAEFGHMSMDPSGERCNCGNRGCWETQVSQRALANIVWRAIGGGQPSLITSLTGNDPARTTVEIVVEAARRHDEVALAALDKVGHSLGIGIASLVNALNPELVVFGGILSLAGDYLMPVVDEEMAHRCLRWNREATRVVLAHYGSDACVMGGVATVQQEILSTPDVAGVRLAR